MAFTLIILSVMGENTTIDINGGYGGFGVEESS